MSRTARGTFTVTLTPQPHVEGVGAPGIGRMALHKVFDGDMTGVAHGQMLGLMTPTEGSAGYVAMDVVEVTLDGRHGTFALQHSGVMTRGVKDLRVIVVPDSGTAELTGLHGTFDIDIRDGQHAYVLEYGFDAAGSP